MDGSDYRTQIDDHNTVPTIAAGEDATHTLGNHPPTTGFAAVMDAAQSPTNTDTAADSSTHETQPDNRIADIDVADRDVRANTLPAIALEPDLFAELEVFIATSDLPDNVKDTARRKLADPTLTWKRSPRTRRHPSSPRPHGAATKDSTPPPAQQDSTTHPSSTCEHPNTATPTNSPPRTDHAKLPRPMSSPTETTGVSAVQQHHQGKNDVKDL